MLEMELRRSVGDFDLEIAWKVPRGAVGLFGPSGSGKSTVLHMLAGLLRPDAGRIVLDGDVLCDTDDGIWIPPHRRGVGVVFQDGRLFPHYTVEGNLRYGMEGAGRGTPGFDDVIGVLELEPLLGRPVGRLSGGERQRTALGRALLAGPRLLLLDEPLASLDRGLRDQILPFLRRVRDVFDIPLLLVSHDLEEIQLLTDRIGVIYDGGMVASGDLKDVVRSRKALALMHDPGPVNVVPVALVGQDAESGISELRSRSGGFIIRGPLLQDPDKTERLVLLRPADVGLASQNIPGASFQNQLPGRIVDVIRTELRSLALVDVGVTLMVEVTGRAVKNMNLVPGREVQCLFKAHALRVPAV